MIQDLEFGISTWRDTDNELESGQNSNPAYEGSNFACLISYF